MSARDTAETVARLARLGFDDGEIVELMKAQRSLHRIAERQCSEDMDDATAARVEKREANILARVEAVAKARGFRVYHQGDPRGCALYLWKPAALRRYAERFPRDPVSIRHCYSEIGAPIYG